MGQQSFTATPTLQDGEVAWTLCYSPPPPPNQPQQCGNGTANSPYPYVTLQKDSGSNPFQFTIANDQTGLGIQFASANPLCVAGGTKPTCPSSNPQIQPPGGGGTKVLTFVYLNTDKSLLKYVLNFTDKNGNAVTSIDPDIQNGGKSVAVGVPHSTALLVAVVVLVVLVAAFFVVRSRRLAG